MTDFQAMLFGPATLERVAKAIHGAYRNAEDGPRYEKEDWDAMSDEQREIALECAHAVLKEIVQMKKERRKG